MSAVIPESKGGRDNPKNYTNRMDIRNINLEKCREFIILGSNEPSEIWTGKDKEIIIIYTNTDMGEYTYVIQYVITSVHHVSPSHGEMRTQEGKERNEVKGKVPG